MDQQLVQRTRNLLKRRFQRIETASIGNFGQECKLVLDWLEKHPILSSVLQHLVNVPGDHHHQISFLASSRMTANDYFASAIWSPSPGESQLFRKYDPRSLEEHASACLEVVRATIHSPNSEFYELLATYLIHENLQWENIDPLESIKEVAVHHLYEYLDEQLDGINAVNGLLQKYKQNVEWFQRERIQQIVEQCYGGKRGERALAVHLQQYIFDQGVDFAIEPSSRSGEVDLLLRDPSGQYTILDAKLINKGATTPSEVTTKLAEGFNQVARYCADYNQPEGFLAVFVNDDVSILIDLEQNDAFRYFKIGGSIIYYIELNISERPSASQAGKAKQITITRDQLLEKIEEVQHEASSIS